MLLLSSSLIPQRARSRPHSGSPRQGQQPLKPHGGDVSSQGIANGSSADQQTCNGKDSLPCKGAADGLGDSSEETNGKCSLQRSGGRNWYRRSLALCALAESVRPNEGASAVAAALREVSSAENQEATWIFTANSKHVTESEATGRGTAKGQRYLGAPLVVGRAPQSLLLSLPGPSLIVNTPHAGVGRTWNVLYGGVLRMHGGLGVSRLQKDVLGSGLRLEPNTVIRVGALRDEELYVGKK